MAKVSSSSTSVPPTVLDLVLEEIHLQRMARLREWQESDIKRIDRIKELTRLKFSDDEGDDLQHLGLVHSSWVLPAYRVRERILCLTDSLEWRLSKMAGRHFRLYESQTCEVYISFSRGYDEFGFHDLDRVWDATLRVLNLFAPGMLVLCVQTSSRNSFCIDACTKRLSEGLHLFKQLRTIRLYSDIFYGSNPLDFSAQEISEHPSFFHALEKLPDFEHLVLRNFLPCHKLVCDTHLEKAYGNFYNWTGDLDTPPDLRVFARIAAESTTLTGKIYSLAELIRSIANTPMQMFPEAVATAGNFMRFGSFKHDPKQQRFIIDASRIEDFSRFREPEEDVDLQPPADVFPCPEWLLNIESLELLVSYSSIKSLSPFPSLKFLRITLTSFMQSADAMQDELSWFFSSLPSSLEIFDLTLVWRTAEDCLHFPQEVHDSLGASFTTLLIIQCPMLKIMNLHIDSGPGPYLRPFDQLMELCKDRTIPTRFRTHGKGSESIYHVHWKPELEYLLNLENYIC